VRDTGWSKRAYESSITSRCWWFTAYDGGWDASHEHGADLRQDDELRAILAMERALPDGPNWARRIVETCINFLPPCGHYLFPRAFLDAVSAIGAQTPPRFIAGCYTVERRRKERMADYLLALDAWLAGVQPEVAARELTSSGDGDTDWPGACLALWDVLGEPTETKQLLIERLLHRQRWWLKAMIWEDDARDLFCRDQYLGNTSCSGQHYGNPGFHDPYFAEGRSSRIERNEVRLSDICPDWEWFQALIRDSWLCAPKVFRFLERALWCIGRERRAASLPSHPLEKADPIPGFLQCEDTYPDTEQTARWWDCFVAALQDWSRGKSAQGEVAAEVACRLREDTPSKRWLVRLLARKLRLLEREQLAGLTRPHPGAKRGTSPPP
jgi:hypothetical protein